MPAIRAAAWPAPLDNVFTQTSDDQLETEEAINALFSRIRPSRFDFAKDTRKNEAVVNPWLSPAEQEQQRSTAQTHDDKANPKPTLLLERQAHVNFLTKMLEPLPGAYTAFDTNRSWLLYWILHSFDLLSVSLDPKGRARAIATLLSFQNKSMGGFGGGPDQISHLMATYAAVSALAIIGGPGPAPTAEDVADGKSVEVGHGGWDEIDRPKMYDWITSLKQPDGSFLVHVNGEVDVRAGYCVVCISTLLGISTPELLDGMAPFIASCQTYEGGIAAASQPTYQQGGPGANAISLVFEDVPRPPLGEAHGGYTYCAAASHLALSLLAAPSSSPPSSSGTASAPLFSLPQAATLNRDALIRWATAQQGIPFEGCGFRGRTNKLVDGCYGWFSGGGLFTVLSAMIESELLSEAQRSPSTSSSKIPATEDWNGMLTVPPTPTVFAPSAAAAADTNSGDGSWKTESSLSGNAAEESDEDTPDLSPLTLFDRVGLQEYILIAAQRTASEGGGLRDKPGKRPDAYHTCYNLAGLSLAQHSVRVSPETRSYLHQHFRARTEEDEEWDRKVYSTMLAWTLSARDEIVVEAVDGKVEGRATNRLNPTHPILNITFPKAKAFMDWAYGQ